MRAPDAASVSSKRVALLSEEDQARFAPICPEFVIEPRYPGDRPKDRMGQWVANGVEVGWLIDPESRTVTIYRPGDQPVVLVDPSSCRERGRFEDSSW